MLIDETKVKVVCGLDGKPIVYLDRDDFSPCKTIDVKITVKLEAQHDGRWPTEGEKEKQFFESAMPMLAKLWEEANRT